MAKAEIKLEFDIAHSTIELAAGILETWLNISGKDRQLFVEKDEQGKQRIKLKEYEPLHIKMDRKEK